MTIYHCKQCQQPFEAGDPIDVLGVKLQPNVCAPCSQPAAMDALISARRLERFQTLCPPTYQETNPNRLDRTKLGDVLAWQFGARGLVLFGATRQGKTRSAWLLVKRLVLEGHHVVPLTAGEFARQCAEAYGESAESGAAFFRRMTRCGLLFIDDFGKFKVTERVEAELFDIIEHRTSHDLPILITTNGTRATFAKAFSAERAEPIFERLREFCTFINFSPAKP
jgi:hypothetical protein